MNDKERLNAIRERLNAATPGPWEAWESVPMRIVHNGEVLLSILYDEPERVYGNTIFIAHAREDIPYLLSEVERVTAENEKLLKLTEIQKICCCGGLE